MDKVGYEYTQILQGWVGFGRIILGSGMPGPITNFRQILINIYLEVDFYEHHFKFTL